MQALGVMPLIQKTLDHSGELQCFENAHIFLQFVLEKKIS